MAENTGSGLFAKLGAGLVIVFIVGLWVAPEAFSARFFRALNSFVDGAGPLADSPRVGMAIVSILLIGLAVVIIRR